MPDYNGKIVMDRLRLIDPSDYIVMISAYSIEDNVISTYFKGAARFIKKPFTKKRLSST